VSSALANVITLTNASDVRNFEVGMSITSASGTSTTQVIGINRGAGTITVVDDENMDTLNDPIYHYGAYQATAANGIQGLQKLFPTTRSSALTVHGVDQSTDWDRLAGTLVNKSGATPYEALMDGILEGKANGADPSHVIMSYDNVASIVNDAQGQKMFAVGDSAQIGFQSVVLAVPDGGVIKVLGSRFCPQNTMYALKADDLELVHWRQKLVTPDDLDGSLLHWNHSAAQWDVRLVSVCDLLACNPIKHVVITL
jgi:hypothetical protein